MNPLRTRICSRCTNNSSSNVCARGKAKTRALRSVFYSIRQNGSRSTLLVFEFLNIFPLDIFTVIFRFYRVVYRHVRRVQQFLCCMRSDGKDKMKFTIFVTAQDWTSIKDVFKNLFGLFLVLNRRFP